MKKLLVLSVMMTMVVWTMGAAFVPGASAATLTAGDLIKASGPAVYYYAADGQRYTFPTESTYMSWYSDFSSVKTITDDELAAIDLAGNVVVRPGTKLVKIDTVSKVFAVEPNGSLVWVKTEAVAKALYGDNWAEMITVIPDGFWTNYTDSGMELDGTTYPEGTLVKYASGADTYYVNADGSWSKVATEAAFTGNMWNWDFVVTAPAAITMTAGADIDAANAMYVDVSQGGGGASTVVPTGSGTLTVALAGDTPAASPVAISSTANFTKISMTATGSALEVSKVLVTKGGYSSNTDVENIKITDLSGIILTNSASLNSNGTASLTFSPALDLAAGETRYFYIKSAVASTATAGDTASFAILSSGDVTSTAASVAGNYPVQGNAMNVISVDIGSAIVVNDGTVTDTTPDAGDENVVLNKFRVEAGTTEIITIESLSVMEVGTASLADVANIELWSVTEGKSLGTVESYDATGRASFTNLNLVVGKGDIYRFEIRVDIVSGAGLTTNADLTDGTDVLMSVKGNSYGFYLTPTATTWSGTNGQGAASQTINSGALAISKSAATPATGNITESPDQVLTVWDFEAKGEDVRVSSFEVNVNLGSGGDADQLISCKLFDGDMTLVAGPVDGVASTDTITFTDTFTVPVGINAYTLKCRVFDIDGDNFGGSGATWQAVLTDASADITAKGVTTNESITATGDNSNGNVQTLSEVSLEATTLGTPAAQSVAAGVNDFVWATFSLDASNSGEDVNVSAVTITDTIASSGDVLDINNAEIWCDVDSSSSVRDDVYEKKMTDADDFAVAALAMSFTENLVITKNTFVRCAVVADLAVAAQTGEQHTFDVSAVTATGYTTGSTASVTPAGAGQQMTVAASGAVTLTLNSTTPKASIFVGGEAAQTLAVFRLTANSVEDLDLDSFKINDIGDETSGGSDTVATYYFYSNVRADGGSVSDPIASKPGADTAEVFLPDGTVTIPDSGYVLITVKADLNLVDGSTIVNADALRISVETSGDVDTTGLSSGAAVDATDTVDSNIHYVYESRPVVTKDASSPSGTLGTGTSTLIGVFKIDNSDGTEDLDFSAADDNDIVFNLSGYATGTSCAAGCGVTFKDKAGNLLSDTATTTDLGGAIAVTDLNLDFTDNALTVPAGDYELIKVYANTTDFTTAGNSLQVWLDDAADANFSWGVISGATVYETGAITFRGDIYANTLGK